MLQPNDRQLIIDLLHPPLGYKLDIAIGTSYSLDLMAMLAAPVAFAYSDAQDNDGQPTGNLLALLRATREYANRMLMFHHPGKISVPKSYHRLLVQMEDSLVEAVAPKGGSFHPKMFFLRFISKDNVKYRVLCLSRNLTFDRAWDTALSLEGDLTSRKLGIAASNPFGVFVESLPSMAPRGLSEVWQRRVEQVAGELRRTPFEIPPGFDEMQFIPIGHRAGSRRDWPFPEKSDKLLVISPFVTAKALKDLRETCRSMEVVSRVDQLDQLSNESLDSFDAKWILNDSLVTQVMDDSSEFNPDSPSDGTTEQAPHSLADRHQELEGLHAKLYVFDKGWNTTIFTGSANATQSAFSRNVEFLVGLTGKKSQCGIDAILGTESNTAGKKRAAGLGGLLLPYERVGDAVEVESPEKTFELNVDRIAKAIVSSRPQLSCSMIHDTEEYRLTLTADSTIYASLLNGYTIAARPLSFGRQTWQELNFGHMPLMVIEPVSMLGITSFLVFRVTDNAQNLTHEFVINIPLVNPPENRHALLLESILSDRSQVQKYLLMLLAGADVSLPALLSESDALLESASTKGSNSSSPLLLESLLKSLAQEPQKLNQIDRLVEDFTKTEKGTSMLPEGFIELWTPIRNVWKKAQKKENSSTSTAHKAIE